MHKVNFVIKTIDFATSFAVSAARGVRNVVPTPLQAMSLLLTSFNIGNCLIYTKCTLPIRWGTFFFSSVLLVRTLKRLTMKTALFWFIAQRVEVISYRRFGTTYRSHPRNSSIFLFWHWKVRVSFFAIYIHSNEIHNVAALIVY